MKNFKIGIKIFLILTILTGVIYPIIVTGIVQIFFKDKANGSIIYLNNKAVGSYLIGQPFENPKFFWSRPSSTLGFPYNALDSGGSNLGSTNPELIKRIEKRIEYIKSYGIKEPIPSCLVLESASGLDPDITPEAAYAQIPRISKYTKIPEDELKKLVDKSTKKGLFGFLGADRVNVLELNIKLLQLKQVYAEK